VPELLTTIGPSQDADTNVSCVSAVTGGSSASRCLPPISYTWNDQSQSKSSHLRRTLRRLQAISEAKVGQESRYSSQR